MHYNKFGDLHTAEFGIEKVKSQAPLDKYQSSINSSAQ